MGTIFEIAAYDQSPEHASIAIEKAFQEIVRLDSLLSDYKPDSALSSLNRSAHFHAEKVPSDLYRVIEQAVQFSRLSDGKFDITIAPLVNLWKAALRGEGTPSRAQQEEVRTLRRLREDRINSPGPYQFSLILFAGGLGRHWQRLRRRPRG